MSHAPLSSKNNDEKLDAFPAKIRNKERMSTLATPIQHHIGSSRQFSKIRKGNKSIQIWKEEINLFLFAEDIIFHTENPKE